MSREAFHIGGADSLLEVGADWDTVAAFVGAAILGYLAYREWKKHNEQR